MSDLIGISIIFIVLVVFVFTFGITRIVDAKKEINKNLCDEKIRFAKQKAEIEMKMLEEKKKKGLSPFSSPPPQSSQK